MKTKGYVMDIQPFSVNDGDGIRTTVFLAGCPLRCQWCSNPEGFHQRELVGWHYRKCIACGACSVVCPEGIGIDLNASREKCIACGRCVEACPVGARTWMVRLTDAEEVLQKIQKHRLFYRQSGGGITFSGGEPTAQPGFLRYLANEIYDMGYSMDLETTGQFEYTEVADILALMDLIFVDLKHPDKGKYLTYTGVSHERVLRNLERMAELPNRIVIRLPLIGNINADDETIRHLAVFVRETIPKASIELLPYHDFGRIKYEALGLPYDHPEFSRPSGETVHRLKSIIEAEGVQVADFR